MPPTRSNALHPRVPRHGLYRTACGCALATVLTALAAGAAGQDAGPEPREPLVLEAYEITAADNESYAAEAGRLKVPERYGDEGSPSLSLPVVRLPSHAASPTAAPVVYLAGGPGGSAIGALRIPWMWEIFRELRKNADVILMDQRGAGQASPSLMCRYQESFPEDALVTRESALAFIKAEMRSCADRWKVDGVDPTAYTTVASADDLEALRRGLGVGKLSLLGFSYGTHLALAAIRRHGERVERVVLVGTEGPDHSYKLPHSLDTQIYRIARLAAEDSAVGADVSDMKALLGRVLERLETEPVRVAVKDRSGDERSVRIGADGLRLLLRMDLGDGRDFTHFPALLAQLERGETTTLARLTERRLPQLTYGFPLMALVMDCASGASAERMRQIMTQRPTSYFRSYTNLIYPEACESVEHGDVGAAYRAPVHSHAAVLFVSGEMDANTPPYQAEEVRWGMPNARHLVVRWAGHEDMLPNPEVQEAVVDHLLGEDLAGGVIDAPRPRFVPVEDGGMDR